MEIDAPRNFSQRLPTCELGTIRRSWMRGILLVGLLFAAICSHLAEWSICSRSVAWSRKNPIDALHWELQDARFILQC